MQNLKTRFLTRKNVITAIFSALLFSLLMLVIILSHATVYSSERDITRFSPDIIQGTTCSFDFACDADNLESISLKFGTYARNNNGTLSVILCDNQGDSIEEWTYDCSQIKDLIYVDFNLTNPIENSKGNTYQVVVTSTSDENMGVCLACNDEVIDLDFENSNFVVSPCYTLGFKSTIASLIASHSKTSFALGIIVLAIIAIIIPLAIHFVLNDFTHWKLLLMLLPSYLLIFSTHRILEHSDTSIVSHKIYLLLAYSLLSIIWIITTIITYNMILKKDKPLHIVAASVLPILSIVSIIFNTPATVPDGDYHYGFAYQYSNYMLGYSTPFKNDFDEEGDLVIYMRDADAELIKSATRTNVHCLSENAYVASANAFFNDDNNYDVNLYKVNDYLRNGMSFNFSNAFLSHIIPAFGITLGRILNLDALSTFYLGRVFNAIFFVLIACLCIKIVPIGKNLMFSFFTIPMTVFLSASLSYDGFVICICVLFISLLIRMMYQENRMSLKQFIALISVALLIVPSKFVYAPLIVCAFAIPNEKIPIKHPLAFKRILMGTIFLSCILIFLIPTFNDLFKYFIEPLLDRIGNGSYVQLILGSIEMATVTVITKSEELLESMIFHAGWGQFYLPPIIYAVYYAIIILSAVKSNEERKFLKAKDRVLFASMMIIISMLLALPLIMYISPDGGDTIEGLNGRYFLCILPLLLFTFRPKLNVSDRTISKANVLSVYMSFICWTYTLLNLFGTLSE